MDNPTTRDQIARLIFVRCGSNLPPIRTAHDDSDRVARLLETIPLGGLLLFHGVWPQTAEALARLKSRSAAPLLVGADIERGAGQQMRGMTVFPHARGVAESDDAVGAVRELADHTAREALGAGIDIAFAPVADVNTNSLNPIIATRAFGEEPHRAAELVAAYIETAEKAGLRTTAKHFPGHGDTHQDSHESLPQVPRNIESIERQELVPFRAAIGAGVSLVMTAHVAYPALDPTGAPATLSAPILEGLLRDSMGFGGAVCSDSLLMAGVRDRFANEGQLAVAALRSGVDLLLDVADPPQVIEAVLRALEGGDLEASRLETALRRIERLAVGRGRPTGAVDLRPGADAALRIARGAVRLERSSTASGARIAPGDRVLVVLLKPFSLPSDPAEQPLASALRERGAGVSYLEFETEITAAEQERAVALAVASDHVVVGLIVKPAAWRAFGLSPSQEELVQRLGAARSPVLAALGVGSVLERFPWALYRVRALSDAPCSQIAVAEALMRA